MTSGLRYRYFLDLVHVHGALYPSDITFESRELLPRLCARFIASLYGQLVRLSSSFSLLHHTHAVMISLLVFYIIFDCILFAFAELTCFAGQWLSSFFYAHSSHCFLMPIHSIDREFYQDWWNSTSFDEFARRWNVPVHTFLLKHVCTCYFLPQSIDRD